MYHRILVPLDGSPTAQRGLTEAIELAKGHDARLHLLHVIDDYPLMMDMVTVLSYQDWQQTLRQQGEQLLNDAQRRADEAGVTADTTVRHVVQERVADVITQEAANASCDLIVMGTHGRRGFNRLMLGSNAELVARCSPTPVLLVKPDQA